MTKSHQALNRLAKWRTIFAGWQLGTRTIDDPESQAVRDHREATMVLRAELNAVVELLLLKGTFTAEEFDNAVASAAEDLSRLYAKKFPGAEATDSGISINPAVFAETSKNWRP